LEVREYLDGNRYSDQVKAMAMAFYALKFPSKTIYEEAQILASLPQGLQKKMRGDSYMSTLESVPLFAELSESAKLSVCNLLERRLCCANEELCSQGEEPEFLYIIRQGEVELSRDGESIALAQAGDMFGELALLGLTVDGQRLRTAVATTECVLLKLNYRSLKLLLITNSELRVTFRQYATRFLDTCEAEVAHPLSPIYDRDKFAHILSRWQDGRINEEVRKPGKIPPPRSRHSAMRQNAEVMTLLHIRLKELSGLPCFDTRAGSVTLRSAIDWGLNDEDIRTNYCDRTFKQRSGMNFQWHTVLKYPHGPRTIKSIRDFPAIEIKILYHGLIDSGILIDDDEDDDRSSALTSQVGVNGDGGFKSIGKVSHQTVPAPHDDSVIACFKVPLTAMCSKASIQEFKDIKLASTWYVGSESGRIELNLSVKVVREVSA
jgi:hypothetical protein